MYCNRPCLCVCLWVCYHDNSKLRASILTKLGLQVKVVTISSWLNFDRPAPPGMGLQRGKIFGSALIQPARSVYVSSKRFFHLTVFRWKRPVRNGVMLFVFLVDSEQMMFTGKCIQMFSRLTMHVRCNKLQRKRCWETTWPECCCEWRPMPRLQLSTHSLLLGSSQTDARKFRIMFSPLVAYLTTSSFTYHHIISCMIISSFKFSEMSAWLLLKPEQHDLQATGRFRWRLQIKCLQVASQ